MILRALAYTATEVAEENEPPVERVPELMGTYAVTWLDIEDPSSQALEAIGARFGLHPLALEDAGNPGTPPRVESYDDTLFVVTRTIVWSEEIETGQLSLFLGKKFVVTVHRGPLSALEDIRVRVRKRQPVLVRGGADFLAYAILDAIVNSYFPHLDRFRDLVDRMEEAIVESPSRTSIAQVHALRRDLTMIGETLRPQRDALGDLERTRTAFFKRETLVYLRGLHDDMARVLDSLDTYHDIVASLMEVHSTLISIELNRVIKVLTVVFTITIPLTIVTSAFGMNVYFYGTGQPEGLYLALGIMGASTIALLVWLRIRRLL